MLSEPSADPGRFVQALHDEARRNAAALGYDLCLGAPPEAASWQAWAHHDYHRLAREHGATCSRTRLILGVGGQSARPPRPRPKALRVVAAGPLVGRAGVPPWYLLEAIAHLALASYLLHGRWPRPDSGMAGGSCRTWADVAAHLRAGGMTLEGLLDERFPEIRGLR